MPQHLTGHKKNVTDSSRKTTFGCAISMCMLPEHIHSARRQRLILMRANRIRETLIRRSFPDLDPSLAEYLSCLDGMKTSRVKALLNPHSYAALDAEILPRYNGLKDFESTASRLADAVMKNEIVGISGDYDCDGNCSTALMIRFLQSCGVPREHIHVHIPNREEEGYGVNRNAVKAMDGKNVSLLIALDNGTLARAPLADAKRLGMDALVIDHHPNSADHPLPAGALVVNPRRHDEKLQQESEGVADLAAVGVSWLVCRRTTQLLIERGHFTAQHSTPPDPRDWLGLVATATIGDVVSMAAPLNRALVVEGLRVIHEGRDPYLSALARTAQLDPASLNEEHIAFRLAPIINAPGRLGQSVAWSFLSPADATSMNIELLKRDAQAQYDDLHNVAERQRRSLQRQRFLEPNPAYDRALATALTPASAVSTSYENTITDAQHALMILSRESNELRKLVEFGVTRQARPLAVQWLKDHPECGTLMLWGDHWHEGVIGIVAGRLKEEFGLPTIIASHDLVTGLCKASARSIRVPGHVVDIGQAVRDMTEKEGLLVKGGGHPMAAGMTFAFSKRDAIRARFEDKLGDISRTARRHQTQPLAHCFDFRIPESIDDARVWATLQERLRPFGEGFAKPRIALTGFELQHMRRSRDGRHIFFTLRAPLPFAASLARSAEAKDTSIECQSFHAAGTVLETLLRHAESNPRAPLVLSGTLSLSSQNAERGTHPTLQFQLEDAQRGMLMRRTSTEHPSRRGATP